MPSSRHFEIIFLSINEPLNFNDDACAFLFRKRLQQDAFMAKPWRRPKWKNPRGMNKGRDGDIEGRGGSENF